MPPVAEFGYLFEYLHELGFVSSTGMGRQVLSYQEIQSWSDLMKVDLTIFEVESIRALSTAYLMQYLDSEEPNCAPPFRPDVEVNVDQRKQVDSFFRQLAAKRRVKRD